ncbi:c-type cytochrome [Verrucomicrobiota bacterium sgz303538]
MKLPPVLALGAASLLSVITVPHIYADDFTLPPGFKVEELHQTQKDPEGSWVSICVDGKGDLIASDQYGYIWRITPPPIGQGTDAKVEQVKISAGKAHGLLWAFDSLYFMGGPIDPNDPKSKDKDERSLWRAKDTDGDGSFDDVKRLATFQGNGEHGPHALTLSPDGKQIYLACGNHTPAPAFQKSLVPQRWQEDHLLPRMWDARGHARGILAPGGWIARVNPDGSDLELVSMGYRNEYDIAFDGNGEMFTYDSDMEWDMGAPWYRPTRICHATSGSEFGWRSGSGKWPESYPDSLPGLQDIGPGSPTGVLFGTGAKFPAKYQRAMFAMDWSFGTLYAIHMEPNGATYKGTRETFLSRNSLPLADLTVRPQDGAMYFVTGGRRNASGVYRVIYTGTESTAPVSAQPLTELQKLRRQIESHHRPNDAEAVAFAWPYLDHPDRFIRYAARIAVEHQPVEQWQQKALAENRPFALREAVIALARCGKDKSVAPALVDRLLTQDWAKLDEPSRIAWLRACSLVFLRQGEPAPKIAEQLLARLDSAFPTQAALVDRELANMLIYLKSPTVVGKAVQQMYTAKDPAEERFTEEHLKRGGGYGTVVAAMQKEPTHKQQIHYAFNLRHATAGWSPELRDRYFAWFAPAKQWKGGNSFPGFLTNARDEALEKIGDTVEKARLLTLATQNTSQVAEIPRAKGPGANYTLADFQGVTIEQLQKRNLAHGKQMFQAALCASCHRFSGEGGVGGPDLTGAAGRYTVQDLLTAILDPNKEVSDQYAFTEFKLKDGSTVLGRIAREDGKNYQLITSFLAPDAHTPLPKGNVKQQTLSKTSPMMTGLLNSLNKDEALDLLGYLMSGTK